MSPPFPLSPKSKMMMHQGIERQGEISMAMSVGIDYTVENWKTCLMEDGQTLELCSFVDSAALLVYLEHTCALYPEPTIALSSALQTKWVPLNYMTDQQLGEEPRWYSNGAQ